MIPVEFLSNIRYFELVRRSTGLLSGTERLTRIRWIAEHNLVLAARCKTTCVLDEDDVLDVLFDVIYSKIMLQEDPSAILALLELGEYSILGTILQEKYRINLNPFTLRDFILNRVNLYHVLSYLSQKMPAQVVENIFKAIKTNGVSINTAYYNSLLRMSSASTMWNVYQEMKTAGFQPDVETFRIVS